MGVSCSPAVNISHSSVGGVSMPLSFQSPSSTVEHCSPFPFTIKFLFKDVSYLSTCQVWQCKLLMICLLSTNTIQICIGRTNNTIHGDTPSTVLLSPRIMVHLSSRQHIKFCSFIFGYARFCDVPDNLSTQRQAHAKARSLHSLIPCHINKKKMCCLPVIL